jgi:RimJ/RimL family protein N-acetyltransferase
MGAPSIPYIDQEKTGGQPEAGSRAAPQAAQACSGSLTLRDGAVVWVRPIRPDDTPRLHAFHARLSPESIKLRYFHPLPALSPEWAERLTHINYADRMALVATIGGGADEQIIAVVRYERIGPTTAEVAFVVEDRWQRRGIATQVLYRLATHAAQHGFKTFVAEIMSTNMAMRNLVRRAGFPFTARYEGGSVAMHIDITAPPFAALPPAYSAPECAPHVERAAGGQPEAAPKGVQ